MRKMKYKERYIESYKKPYIVINEEKLPKTLPYLTEGSEVKRIEIKAIGTCEINDEVFAFQDVRVYVSIP